MLPAETVILAASRWLRILRTSTVSQAWSLIRADAKYTDLTQTQYASALEWLKAIGLVVAESGGAKLAAFAGILPSAQMNKVLFERSLERAMPAWLPDADLLIPDSSELPQDVAGLAEMLGLSENDALSAVRHVHGRIDLALRAKIGLAGECALIDFLEGRCPGSTVHVANTDDGFGYDVLFQFENKEWHLEVKSTTRRGRLAIYLSRHEHEVGLRDPNWRLVVVGLDEELRLSALATVRYAEVAERAPRDLSIESKWQSASHQLTSKDLVAGLTFLNASLANSSGFHSFFSPYAGSSQKKFAWMPLG